MPGSSKTMGWLRRSALVGRADTRYLTASAACGGSRLPTRGTNVRFATRMLATLAIAVPAASLSAAPALGATTGGVACTIVGTAGPDRLVGTSHHDVICG